MTHRNRLFTACALLTLLAAFAPKAQAQLLVYRLNFEPTGETINYRAYQNGFYIAPATGGTGTLILTSITGAVKNMFEFANFGELFVAKKGNSRKAVISATAANSVSTTTFFAIGDATETMDTTTAAVEGEIFFAKTMKGYAVSADNQTDLPFFGDKKSDVGVAGASYLTARLDDANTNNAIKQAFTLAQAVADIELDLKAIGYVKPTTGGTTTGGGTTTTTPTGSTGAGGR